MSTLWAVYLDPTPCRGLPSDLGLGGRFLRLRRLGSSKLSLIIIVSMRSKTIKKYIYPVTLLGRYTSCVTLVFRPTGPPRKIKGAPNTFGTSVLWIKPPPLRKIANRGFIVFKSWESKSENGVLLFSKFSPRFARGFIVFRKFVTRFYFAKFVLCFCFVFAL